MRRRTSMLVTIFAIALVAVACGRATDDQINQALGITPTPTLSSEQIVSATEAANATATARVLAASSPGAAAMGDVAAGERQFNTWCTGCHGPGGAGPDILSPGSPGAAVTAESVLALVREGTGHATPPGAYKVTEISDKQVRDITAYLLAESGG